MRTKLSKYLSFKFGWGNNLVPSVTCDVCLLQVRFVVKYRNCDGNLVLKVTDDTEVNVSLFAPHSFNVSFLFLLGDYSFCCYNHLQNC